MENIWWRSDPLTRPEAELLETLFRAHEKSAFRDNVSSVVVANAASGSGDIGKAIAAGILTLGKRHAPLKQTVELLNSSSPANEIVGWMLKAGMKIPGWGGSFQKGNHDPIWEEMRGLIADTHPDMARKLSEITDALACHGYTLYPNPSAYTAAAAIILGIPAQGAIFLFIAARLAPWTQIAFRNL